MARGRSVILVLDCAFCAWRWEQVHASDHWEKTKKESAVVLPFTFADAPHDLVRGNGDIVLRPTGGVKS